MRHSPYHLGTVTAGSIVADPANAVGAYDETRSFTVAIPGLPNATCELARKEPDATEVGTLVLFSASDGSAFPLGTPQTEQWAEDQVDAGWRIVQVRWPNGWHNTTGTAAHGAAKLAGRPATIVKYISNTYAVPNAGNLVLYGGSGGASQVGYCMSHYNLASRVTSVLLSGGPPFASIKDLCVGSATYAGDATQRAQVDDGYEETVVAGPCQNQVATDKGSTWAYGSIIRGNLAWPRPVFIHGQDDTTVGPAHGALVSGRQPNAKVLRANGTPHNVLSTTKGLTTIANAANQRAVICQSNPGLTATTASLGVTLPYAVKAGNLLVVVHRATTGLANMSGPSGFTLANDGTDNAQVLAATAGAKVYWKVATGGEESGLSVTTTTSVLNAADMYEIESFAASGSWGVEFVEIEADGGGSVTTFPTVLGTSPSTSAKAWCIAVLNSSGGFGSTSGWTNGYIEQASAASRRLATAAKSIESGTTTEVNVTIGSATRIGGILVGFTKE
jgi:hypothetical protein